MADKSSRPPHLPKKEWKLPDDEGYDYSDRHTVPDNPSKASGVIVIVGTAFAAAALPGYCIVSSNWDFITSTAARSVPVIRQTLGMLLRMPGAF